MEVEALDTRWTCILAFVRTDGISKSSSIWDAAMLESEKS